MMSDYDPEERRQQIAVLLAYLKVGPLSAAAIAINLGTSAEDIQAALASLLRDGRIVQTGDGRLTSPSAADQERAGSSEPAGSRVTGGGTGESA
jgi:predicted ArsR family transcriptional regulator